MSHGYDLEKNLSNAHARVGGAMPLRPAHALAALLLEYADLRPARLAFDDGQHARLGDERRAGHDFATVFFDEQHALERQLRARLAGSSVDRHDAAGLDARLPAAIPDDGVHSRHLCKGESVLPKWLTCQRVTVISHQCPIHFGHDVGGRLMRMRTLEDPPADDQVIGAEPSRLG